MPTLTLPLAGVGAATRRAAGAARALVRKAARRNAAARRTGGLYAASGGRLSLVQSGKNGAVTSLSPANPILRQGRPEDLEDLYSICLLTGDSGEDASGIYRDPRLLGHIYAAPYLVLEPRLTFVLEDSEGVSGYVLGALDSRDFEERLEREWWPRLREQYPLPETPEAERSPDERMIANLYRPGRASDTVYAEYPSHLHIDLLPRAQGSGNGGRLMRALLARLRELGSPGVHLGVGSRNERAIGFYKHVGFSVLKEVPGALIMGLKL